MSNINTAPTSADLILRLFRFLLKRSGGDYEAAAEAMQESLVSALKSYRTFRHKSSYFTWLCKIALNKLSDYYRAQIRHQSHFVVPAVEKFNSIFDQAISHEEKLALDELKAKVNACLNLLPSQYRQLLQLRYYEELSNREIGFKLKISTRSLEGKLYRAKKLLAKLYAGST